MSGQVVEAPSEAARRRRESFFSAFRSIQRVAADAHVQLSKTTDLDTWNDDFREPPHPYPGLRSFNPREGSFFFGRERDVSEIRHRLSTNRVVVVLGGSGSGKSSVIRAGLMPRLTSTMALSGRSGNWYAAEFRPRLNPMRELALALADLVQREFPEPGTEIPGDTNPRLVSPENETYESPLARIQSSLLIGNQGEERAEISTRPEDRSRRAELLCNGLFDFVDNELDRLDRAATGGYRSGRSSLLLLIDQFEEVFRPEVPRDRAGGRQDLLDTIIAACARINDQQYAKPEEQSGLFIAITMRSEELHRCAEHPSLKVGKDHTQHSLADLVNRSFYLLDLLDPEQDTQELREAIVQPARRVFEDWGIPMDPSNGDAPFEPNVVKWLLEGAAQLSHALEHRADQLPLLQHALQTMWHRAVDDWEAAGPVLPTICRSHLGPDGVDKEIKPADLVACLNARANESYERAIQRYVRTVNATSQTTVNNTSGGEAAIRAIFRSLARRDDRGNWARRFAEFDRIAEFLNADRTVPDGSTDLKMKGLCSVLVELIESGFLTGGDGRPYDISHEALVRNWRQCQLWLLKPEEAAQALVQAVYFVDPGKLNDFISPAIASSLAVAVGDAAILPRSWAKEQVIPILDRQSVREKWAGISGAKSGEIQQIAEQALNRIDSARIYAQEQLVRYAEITDERLQTRRYEQDLEQNHKRWQEYAEAQRKKFLRWLGIPLLVSWAVIAIAILYTSSIGSRY
jgi:hypothetical protein